MKQHISYIDVATKNTRTILDIPDSYTNPVIEKVPKRDELYAPLAYISNMSDMYIASDFVIARGGAVTCAELAAANSYALIVPLPIGNGEQVANAADLIEKGAARICLNSEFTADWLISNIDSLALAADQWNLKRSQTNNIPAAEVIGKMILKQLSRIKR